MSSLTTFLSSAEASTFVEAFSSFLQNNSQKISLSGETHKHTVKYGELSDYALVGTAYDYLLRTRITYINDIHVEPNQLVAYIAMCYLAKTQPSETILFNYMYDTIKHYLQVLIPLFRIAYQNKTKLTISQLEEMILTCLKLAKFDQIYRKSQVISINDLTNESLEPYVQDLMKLWINTDMSLFESKINCFSLNPVIGNFIYNGKQTAITKADGDLIIDDRMIDIKTTSKIDYEHFVQVFCYAIMINHKFKTKIDTLQLYFSRYNRIATLSMNYAELKKLESLFIQSVMI